MNTNTIQTQMCVISLHIHAVIECLMHCHVVTLVTVKLDKNAKLPVIHISIYEGIVYEI